jgi:hypothetical protein
MTKRNIMTSITAAMLMSVVGIGLAPAHASNLDPTKIIRVIVKANVNVHNHYPFPIQVVMDSNREAHVIAAGGVATFTKANKGDRPTFYAYKDGAVIASKQLFLDGNKTVEFR